MYKCFTPAVSCMRLDNLKSWAVAASTSSSSSSLLESFFPTGIWNCPAKWLSWEAQLCQAPKPKPSQHHHMAPGAWILDLPALSWQHRPGASYTQWGFLLLTLACSPDENIQSTLVMCFSSVLWKTHPIWVESPTWAMSSGDKMVNQVKLKV